MQKKYSNSDKKQFELAQKYSKAGDFKNSKMIMEELVSQNPDSSVFHAVLANAYWDMKKIELAISEFKKAVELSPQSETASLGLLHCLWGEGNEEEALEEMKRFVANSHSSEYEVILKSILEKS